jgi:hypothetical protein
VSFSPVPIFFACLILQLNVARPGNYPGVKNSTMTWQQLTGGTKPAAAEEASSSNALILAMGGGFSEGADVTTKPLRELFVGNIIEGMVGTLVFAYVCPRLGAKK